jgi:cutinase
MAEMVLTQEQDNNKIPNFPANKVKIICQPGDLVCFGTLTITAAHLTYGERANEGAAFLTQQINSAQAKIKARKAKRAAEEAAKKAVTNVKKMVGRALVV